jgi:MFS family permease
MRTWIGIAPALIIAHLSAAALMGPIGQGLGQMWELSAIQSMWLQAAFIVGLVARIPIGVFASTIKSDRFVFLLTFAVSVVTAALFYFYASDFMPALILRLIGGAALGAMIYPALNMVTANGTAKAGIGLGIVIVVGWAASIYLVQFASTVNLGALGSMFPAGGGWNTVFLLNAILGAIYILPALWLVPKAR